MIALQKMKAEYDFSQGERGKFYSSDAVFSFPVYLEPDASDLSQLVDETRVGIQELTNPMNDFEIKDRISSWIRQLSEAETLPQDIQAIYVGLFEGSDRYQIYLTGSRAYDPEDDDWACNQDFDPTCKYLDSGVSTQDDWQTFEQAVVDIVRTMLDDDLTTILHQAAHVSVGFDGGNLNHITQSC